MFDRLWSILGRDAQPDVDVRPQGREMVQGHPTTGASAAPGVPPVVVQSRVVVPLQKTAVAIAPSNELVPAEDEAALLRQIAGFAGRVVTAPGEKYDLGSSMTEYVAAFDNGWTLYGRGHELNPKVREAIQSLRFRGYDRTRSIPVGLDVIREVYLSHQRRLGGRLGVAQTDMQEYLYGIIQKAFSEGATDVRIRAFWNKADIWMRRLGSYVPMEGGDIPPALAKTVIRTAFNNAAVSDANQEELRSQSAQVSSTPEFRLPPGVSGLRLEFAPLPMGGRHLAIRILPEEVLAETDIDHYGYAPIHVEQIKRMRRNPAGMMLFSGPTGHGKSTTLKACLEAIYRYHEGRKNILTAEDPTEYLIQHVSQIPVWKAKTTEERKEAFTDTIRSVLRLDPDIVMIGEIRDSASAGLAFKAAMAGHLVLSSIHTNDAISIPARLRDEGVEKYKLGNAANLVGLVAQRLVRGVCKHCCIPLSEIDHPEARRQFDIVCDMVGDDLAALARGGRPGGCLHCKGDGYVRRSAVAETILCDQTFLDHIVADDLTGARRYWLDNLDGMTMREHGLAKVLAGIVDPRDVEHEVGMLDMIDRTRIGKVVVLAESLDHEYVQTRGRRNVAMIAESKS